MWFIGLRSMGRGGFCARSLVRWARVSVYRNFLTLLGHPRKLNGTLHIVHLFEVRSRDTTTNGSKVVIHSLSLLPSLPAIKRYKTEASAQKRWIEMFIGN